MSNASLLRVQQTLHAVARSIIEFLGDARDALRDTSGALDETLRRTSLACGRCLGCWLAQETGVLRQELADKKVLAFLLSLSRYSSPQTTESPALSTSHAPSADVSSLPPPPPPPAPPASLYHEEGASSDSDDEEVPEPPRSPGDAGGASQEQEQLRPSAAPEPSGDERGDERGDPLWALLPALASICEEDDGGISGLLDLTGDCCGVHDVVANFIVAELEGTARAMASGDAMQEQRAGSLVWALGLLFRLLTRSEDAASEIISSGNGVQGRLADHRCFVRVAPALVRCASDRRVQQQPGLAALLSNHAVCLFLVIEANRDQTLETLAEPPLRDAANMAVKLFMDRTADAMADVGHTAARRSSADPMLQLARKLAALRA